MNRIAVGTSRFKVEEIIGDDVTATYSVIASSPSVAAERATRLAVQPRAAGRFFVRVTEESNGAVSEFGFAGLPG